MRRGMVSCFLPGVEVTVRPGVFLRLHLVKVKQSFFCVGFVFRSVCHSDGQGWAVAEKGEVGPGQRRGATAGLGLSSRPLAGHRSQCGRVVCVSKWTSKRTLLISRKMPEK